MEFVQHILLLFGRKVMTNLDSIIKSRDITLSTKVRLVKAMVFPVVMYGCETWTLKKTECRSIDAFELWCWRRLLRGGKAIHSRFLESSMHYVVHGVAKSRTQLSDFHFHFFFKCDLHLKLYSLKFYKL